MEKLELMVVLLIYDITGSSTQSLPCHTASGDNCSSSICPNTEVTYTCTISGTPGGVTDWTLPTGTCTNNAYTDKIRLSQFVSFGQCAAQGSGVPSMCGPYRASSIQPFSGTNCLSSILTVNITAAMNGSTVTCNNTDFMRSASTVISMATINIVGFATSDEAWCQAQLGLNSGGLAEAGATFGAVLEATEYMKHQANNETCSALGWVSTLLAVDSYGAWGPAPTPSPPTSHASIISSTSAATAAICVPSIDVSTAVGITVSITFIMAFSLGVLVAICISCISKTRSKTTSPHPSTPNVPYEMVGINQKKIGVIPLETNDAYGTVK
ncbi:hypothetical protein EMCRGX_G012086 [Ephydatia muelleri]